MLVARYLGFERFVGRWRAVRSIAGADCVWDNDNSPDMFVDAGRFDRELAQGRLCAAIDPPARNRHEQ